MTKRANREGSIFKRKDGRWVAAVTLTSGKRWLKYSKTQYEARAKLKAMLKQLDQGSFSLDAAQATVEEFLKHWLSIARAQLRPKTAEQYRQIIERYIVSEIGDISVQNLRSDHIQTLYACKLESGIGPRTVRLIHSVLHRALNQALRWNIIGRNPASAVEKPKLPHQEMKCWSIQEAQHFLDIARDHRLYALFHLAITTGLRRGELLGLKWSDVDFSIGRLQIMRQLYRVAGQGLVLNEPKTRAGRRSISLARIDLDILKQRRKLQIQEQLFAGGDWQNAENLIFTSLNGTPLDPDNLSRDWRKLRQLSGLPSIRFHDLRHTAATIMLSQGVHPKIVQERLGHSSINITLDTYSHVLQNMQREAADRIDALFGSG